MKYNKYIFIAGVAVVIACFVSGVSLFFVWNTKKKSESDVVCSTAPRTRSSDNFLLGFTTLEEKSTPEKIPVKGTIPSWLEGTLYRVGPGQFEVTDTYAVHWLDGLAMVHRFAIEKGTITYSNALIKSDYYENACKTGVLESPRPNNGKSLLSRCLSSHSSNPTYDNVNVNVLRYGKHTLALTETPTPLEFNPVTLETKKPFAFDDSLKAHFSTAHPHFDPETQELYGFLVHFGKTSEYIMYKMKNGSKTREKIGSVKVSKPAYMHSFALTSDYLILTEHPFVVRPMDLLFGNKTFLEYFQWKKEQGTTFFVFDRHDGELVGKYTTDAFFALHHINAFEPNKNTIVLDLATYPDAQILHAYTFDKLYSSKKVCFPHAQFARFTIDLQNGTVTKESKYPITLEMPRINYEQYNGKPYQFVYGISADTKNAFANQLIKMDVTTGSYSIWQEQHCFPCEPIFVPNPKGTQEDDGVILSVVLNTQLKRSFILVLNAKTFKEQARALLPHHVPFTVHGNFFSGRD